MRSHAIRQLSPAGVPAAEELLRRCFPSEPRTLLQVSLSRALDPRFGRSAVATAEGGLLGIAVGCASTAGTVFVNYIAVEPSQRRSGIASELLLKLAGGRELDLYVEGSNAAALRLYAAGGLRAMLVTPRGPQRWTGGWSPDTAPSSARPVAADG
jgi:ribosomal protein S18 acetylase RimI-like enzyme